MDDKRTVDEIKQGNFNHFMEEGPRLSYGYGTFVVAKDSKAKKVLLGGLGAMGMGQLWFAYKEEEKYVNHPGWDEAPERSSPNE